jgi:hypothetical protein
MGAGARVRGYMGAGTGAGTGTWARVRVQRVFFPKNTARPFSNPYPCTRLPAYTRARVRAAGTRVRVVPGGF